MAAPRLTTLAIKGLVTTPNEYGVYPEGSCKVLENWRCVALNQWEVIRDRYQIIQSGVSNDRIRRIVALYPGVFLTIATDNSVTSWRIYRNGDSSTAFTVSSPLSLTGLFESAGYLTSIVKRSRCMLNSKQGVIVLDNLNPSTAGERNFRCPGLPAPAFYSLSANFNEEVIPDTVMVSYQSVVRRESADGYTLISTPSFPMRIRNYYGFQVSFNYYITWKSGDYQAGDTLELYRSAGLTSTDYSTDTGTSMRLVASRKLTATDITNQYAGLTDRQPLTAPLYETNGAEIYTSPYQEGSTKANLPPPVCKAMAQWRDYTFYGNLTEEPSWTADVPAGFFDSASSSVTAWIRQYGIGLRRLSAVSISSGSPVISGVSAADIVGIKVGQIYANSYGFPYFSKVIAVGASTVTMEDNSTVTDGSTDIPLADVIELNGYQIPITRAIDIAWEGYRWLSSDMAFFPSEAIPLNLNGSTSEGPVVGLTVLARPRRNGIYSSFSVRATNGANYSPPLPEISDTALSITTTERPNFFRWSKQNQPEAVPSANEGIIGAGAIVRLLPTTDCLWALCTDGAYRISGEAGVWGADLIDPTFIPVAPDACCVLNDVVYAYTPRGFCSLMGVTTSLITRGVLDAEFPGQPFEENPRIHLCANTVTEEVMVIFENSTQGGNATTYLYSTLYKQWSTVAFTDAKLTAGTSVQASTSGNPNYMVFGSMASGGAPKAMSWYDGGIAPQSLMPLPKLTLQPIYAGDPFVLKRWIDSTWLFGPVASTTMSQTVNDSSATYTEAQLQASTPIDTRASMGISRRAAIGPSIRIAGLAYCSLSDVPPVLKGLSLRYLPLTTQQKYK